MLIDDVKIEVKAGNGGKGAVAFNKNMMSLGPAGGDGGLGASVYLEGVIDISALHYYRTKKVFHAENGMDGRGQFRDGKDGEDLILKVPVGTALHSSLGLEAEITKVGERILVAQGGRGGKGNFKFRSPRNTSPTQFTEGIPGEEAELHLELKLIADVGLIGLPNVGKSSLLNALTNAKSKVANYEFTTLEPNLGSYYGLILADIPGLIEGASEGKGLGIKFLKHVERTNTLFHLISAQSEDPGADYKTVREELKKYNPKLIKKEEYVFVSKIDEVTPVELKKKLSALRKKKLKPIPLSIIEDETLKEVQNILNKILKDKTA